jgi:hypothetical protein
MQAQDGIHIGINIYWKKDRIQVGMNATLLILLVFWTVERIHIDKNPLYQNRIRDSSLHEFQPLLKDDQQFTHFTNIQGYSH